MIFDINHFSKRKRQEKWTLWEFTSIITYKILLEGRKIDQFFLIGILDRGLIPPYLFILIMEVLEAMIQRQGRARYVHGIQVAGDFENY